MKRTYHIIYEPFNGFSSGKNAVRRVDYDAYDYSNLYNDGGDYNYDLEPEYGGQVQSNKRPPRRQENSFSAADIAEMKQ